MGILLLARAVQGAGGGALQPISQAILLESFPPEKRGLAMAVFALGVVVAPVLGPTFGGWLTDNYSWRWSFYINIPIGILAVFMIMRYVEDPPYIKNAKPGRIDLLGLGIVSALAGMHADHPRQGTGRRLVRRDLDSLGGIGAGGRVCAVSGARVRHASRWST